MKRKSKDVVTSLKLPAIDGTFFDLDDLKGKRYLLSFYRFAACPFCNLRIHEMVTRYKEFPKDFIIVAIFDSPLDNLQRHADKHKAPFPILADEQNTYYRAYGIERSWLKTIRGVFIRMPSLLKSMFIKGYIPWTFKGKLNTMPADLLVDEHGVIQVAHYGKDEGDHLSFEQIKAFALEGTSLS